MNLLLLQYVTYLWIDQKVAEGYKGICQGTPTKGHSVAKEPVSESLGRF